MRRLYIFIALLAVSSVPVLSQPAVRQNVETWRAKPALKPDESDVFFGKGMIPQLKLEISPPEMQKLRKEERKYVHATLTENGTVVFKDVAVKLKGAAGSFRGVDDRPALTLNMSKFNKGHRFHSLHKFHLNNSVQDPTLLHELLCSELFLAAGVPTARVTHARVWFNKRDLGLYVFKEGYDKGFLRRHFADHTGNLYDGGFLQDIDANLERDEGTTENDHRDLAALVAACRTPNLDERKLALATRLNIQQFYTFMAIEIMTAHWDGYCRNRNNYRVYFDPMLKQAHFVPHGMDQMFGDMGGPVFQRPGAIVAQGVLQVPELEAAYHSRIRSLAYLFDAPTLVRRIDELVQRLNPVLVAMGGNYARDHGNMARDLKNKVTAVCTAIQNDIRNVPIPAQFDADGKILLTGWQPKMETQGAKIESIEVSGRQLLSIDAGNTGDCSASWRTSLMLPPGKYLFLGLAKVTGVVTGDGEAAKGVGLRISGGGRTNRLVGTTNWTRIEFPFEVTEPRAVEFVAELKAIKGKAEFDLSSLKIRKAIAQ